MDIQKNKKLLLMAGGTVVLSILLLALASATKKKSTSPAPATPEQAAPAQDEGSSLRDTWAKIDEANEIVKTKSGTALPASTTTDENDLLYEDTLRYPCPSFVSSSGDTLIYLNGVYKRVDWVKPPEEKPDTLVINGKKYVEVKGLESQYIPF